MSKLWSPEQTLLCKHSLPTMRGSHEFNKCDKNEIHYKCPNCHGNHSAGYKECPKYIEIQNTLEMSTNQKISYAEAAKKIRINKKPPTLDEVNYPNGLADQSSTQGQSVNNHTVLETTQGTMQLPQRTEQTHNQNNTHRQNSNRNYTPNEIQNKSEKEETLQR